jgi:co-chaperonin GroES (HSP10)
MSTNKSSLRPTSNKLIVEKIEQNNSNSTLVFINEQNTEQVLATVVRVGEGSKTEGISVGEKVWFGKFSGTEIYENIYVLNAEDVLAIEECV